MARGTRTRLTDSPEFEKVYRRGTAYKGRLFSVHAFPNELGTVRLGLSVSKKVGGAVVRNRIRRRIKEVFYATSPEVSENLDIVISVRPAASTAGFEELRQEFRAALRKIEPSNGIRSE